MMAEPNGTAPHLERSREEMMAEPNGTARGREADPFRMGRIEVPKQFRKAPIGVFWDIEQCQLPALCNGGEIVEKIKSTVSSLGYKGQAHIIIIGDTKFISPDADDDLQSAGIKLRYIHGEMGRTGVQVFSKMVNWLWGVTGPVNILFISKISEQRCLIAKNFSGFPTSEYNFIQKSLALGTIDVAKYLWDWSDLLDGLLQSRSQVCSWGGDKSEDIDNKYYQCKQARGGRVRRKKKLYHRTTKKTSKPRVKTSFLGDSSGENNRDRKAKNYHYHPY